MAKRILVVEDQVDTRAILRAVLEFSGFEVVVLETAEEMLAQIDALSTDLIVLDFKLPGMDGCDALQELRRRNFTMPVFMFSEFYDLFSEKIKSCRPDAFFPKSKGPIELMHAISARLSTTA
jgi:two-component system alkaline phosphatase synthesis response regulator PhoP